MDIHFIIITVATEYNDQLKQFKESCKINNVPYKILGLNTIWKGGDMTNGTGGGQKVNLLKEELEKWGNKQLKSTIVLFSDSYDVIVLSSAYEIMEKYIQFFKNRIVFSTEKCCWPNPSLEKYYPITESNYKYLNSGGFIGNAYEIYNMIKNIPIKDSDDDQLYYTKIFLFTPFLIQNEWIGQLPLRIFDAKRCNNNSMILDYTCEIFQTLNEALDDIIIEKNRIKNIKQDTYPCIIHGNGPKHIKNYLNELNNTLFTPFYISNADPKGSACVNVIR